MVSGRTGMRLELWKFGVYIGIPVLASTGFNDPETIRYFVDYYEYIKYPAKPQSNESLRKELEEQRENHQKKQEQMKKYREEVKIMNSLNNSKKQTVEAYTSEEETVKSKRRWFPSIRQWWFQGAS